METRVGTNSPSLFLILCSGFFLVIQQNPGGRTDDRSMVLRGILSFWRAKPWADDSFCSPFSRSTLEGYYVDDALQGQGVYTYEDGGVLQGTYVDGELNGPAQEYDTDGRLIFKGQYKDNIRHGVCWIYYPVSLVTARFAGK